MEVSFIKQKDFEEADMVVVGGGEQDLNFRYAIFDNPIRYSSLHVNLRAGYMNLEFR